MQTINRDVYKVKLENWMAKVTLQTANAVAPMHTTVTNEIK
jgi:hypothetical protein